jgi:hypothetical protein
MTKVVQQTAIVAINKINARYKAEKEQYITN